MMEMCLHKFTYLVIFGNKYKLNMMKNVLLRKTGVGGRAKTLEVVLRLSKTGPPVN